MRPLVLGVLVCIVSVFIQHSLIADTTYSYIGNIKTIIDSRCLNCHQNWAPTYQTITAAQNLVIPGDPDNSRIIWRIEGTQANGSPTTRMPYGGPYLSDDTIALFRAWITQGAPEDIPTGVNDNARWMDVKRLYE